jgi:hypothetical protein
MAADDLGNMRDELAAAGVPSERLSAVRIVSSGRLSGMPYLRVPSGETAVNEWRTLRRATCSKRYPVILGNAEDVPLMHEMFRARFPSVLEVIAAGEQMDQRDEWQPLLKTEMDRWTPPSAPWPRPSAMTYVHGPWPDVAVTRNRFLGPSYVGMAQKRATVDIAIPVCSEPWMIPACLQSEPHNDLPEASVQCAVLRSWYRRFGAELVWNGRVVFEFLVTRPPATREAAMELAREHYFFCPDRLDQVLPSQDFDHDATLEALAASLMVSSIWYFWWD